MENITSKILGSDITSLANDVTKSTFSSILSLFKPYVDVALAIIIIILVYWLIKLILAGLRNRRIKLTYKNTKLILEKLDKLEEKIDKLEKHKDKKKS
ncbi:MAG: hypothetical protein NT076_00590 [Candidatus Pacearchaeota archaeon]|nr:hypothetical protein [Candidatus Pacearchaeota archaeon]